MWGRMLDVAVGIVYPGGCLACNAETSVGERLCPTCRRVIREAQDGRQCLRCAAPVGPHSAVRDDCPECRTRGHSFRRVLACGPYEGPLGTLIRNYKYQRFTVLADELSRLMLATLKRRDVAADVVVSVPMHPLSAFWRGFDHAGLLAEKVANGLGRPRLKRVLRRRRLGSRQTGLSYHARLEAVRGAFRARPEARLKGRSVLLVDDVLTTGATASECARTLHSARAGRVTVVVVARRSRSFELQPPDDDL